MKAATIAAADGTGQALEIALVGAGRARIEARQAQRRRDGVEEGRQPAEAAPGPAIFGDAHHAPLVGDDGRRQAEGHHVREAVVFLAEGAFGAGRARRAAVERVEDRGDEDRDAGRGEVLVDGGDDAVEAGEQAAGGQQVGQQVDACGAGVAWSDVLRCVTAGNHSRGLLLRCPLPCDCATEVPYMRLSQYPINTLKETPAEAEVVSHQLMLRAGLIRRLAAGIYSWLPLGLRALRRSRTSSARRWTAPARSSC